MSLPAPECVGAATSEVQRLTEEAQDVKLAPPEEALRAPHWTVAAQIILSSTIGYMLVYFLRYPILMLTRIREQPFGTIFGVEFLVKDSMSMAFLLGFAIAKIPAAIVMSSPLYFNHRFLMIILLNLLAASLISLPVALSNGDPIWTTLGLFLGCFPSSWMYGGMISYFEGRTTTDLILAMNTPGYISAGGFSRGAAQFVLNDGIAERWTPLLISTAVFAPLAACFYILDCAPKPNAYEILHRKERTGMSMQQRVEFVSDFSLPLFLLITAYAMLTAMRQFRDLDARSLFIASNDGEIPPASFFTLVDVLPAIASFFNLMIINSIQDNYRAITIILSLMAGMLVFSLITTGLFAVGAINGLVWQVTVGIGTYGAYAVTVPLWDRMVAVSPMAGGTCTFIIFVSDMAGYIMSIAMTFWQRFAAPTPTLDVLLRQFITVFVGGSVGILILLAIAMLYFSHRKRRDFEFGRR